MRLCQLLHAVPRAALVQNTGAILSVSHEGGAAMNTLYEQLFNPQYVNYQSYLNCQAQQAIMRAQHEYEQQAEIAKAVKAIHDYFEAMRKLDPQHHQEALLACAVAAMEETYGRR